MSGERILIVDDDKDIVRLVQEYLKKAGFDTLTAYDGETAVHALRRERPDLLVLDLMLPNRDGWDITRLIRNDESLAATPVIMLTARVEDTDKIVGLEMGADDYVTKPFNPRELVARVRSLLRRSQFDKNAALPEVLSLGPLRLDIGQRQLKVDNENTDLTPTEFDLLRVLMDYPGYVFTRDELIEKGMGYAYAGLGRTLDSHIKNLRRKIEPDPKKPTYIETIYGIGYRMKAAK